MFFAAFRALKPLIIILRLSLTYPFRGSLEVRTSCVYQSTVNLFLNSLLYLQYGAVFMVLSSSLRIDRSVHHQQSNLIELFDKRISRIGFSTLHLFSNARFKRLYRSLLTSGCFPAKVTFSLSEIIALYTSSCIFQSATAKNLGFLLAASLYCYSISKTLSIVHSIHYYKHQISVLFYERFYYRFLSKNPLLLVCCCFEASLRHICSHSSR